MTKPRPGEATTLGEVHKWFQQPNHATSLQGTRVLQVTHKKLLHIKLLQWRHQNFPPTTEKNTLAPFLKKRLRGVRDTTPSAQVSPAISTPLPELDLCLVLC